MSYAVCLFCGARAGNDPLFEQIAFDLGQGIAQRGWKVIYGGGRIGLMGAAARGALSVGGQVVGIIPQRLLEREQGMLEASELIVTTTLRQRKALMEDRADAFIALPGGIGTLEELIEIMTLKQLGFHRKPIVLVNIRGYYDPLVTLLYHMIGQGFLRPDHTTLYALTDSVDEALSLVAQEAKGE